MNGSTRASAWSIGLALSVAGAGALVLGSGSADAATAVAAASPPVCVPLPAVKIRPQIRSCKEYARNGMKWRACAQYAPSISDVCVAATTRSPGVDVDYSWFGKTDCRSSARKRSVDTIILHNGGTAGVNARTWQCRPASAHYTIERDGSIFQHVGEERVAHHIGRFNARSIGIEIAVGRAHKTRCNALKPGPAAALARRVGETPEEVVRKACAPTPAQYRSVRKLVADIRSRHNVPRHRVFGHCEVGRGNHFDPSAFDWTQIGLSNEAKLKRTRARKANKCHWYHLY